jgi:hypothetical protein
MGKQTSMVKITHDTCTQAQMGVGSQHHTPANLLQRKTQYPLYRRLCGSWGYSGQAWKILLPLGFNPQPIQSKGSSYSMLPQMPNALLIMTKKNRECIFHITAEVHTEI